MAPVGQEWNGEQRRIASEVDHDNRSPLCAENERPLRRCRSSERESIGRSGYDSTCPVATLTEPEQSHHADPRSVEKKCCGKRRLGRHAPNHLIHTTLHIPLLAYFPAPPPLPDLCPFILHPPFSFRLWVR